jgi:hypothetical protein
VSPLPSSAADYAVRPCSRLKSECRPDRPSIPAHVLMVAECVLELPPLPLGGHLEILPDHVLGPEAIAALARHQHGNFRLRQNLVRFAADHESRHPAPAVGGHEDHVAASFRRSLDNFLPRMFSDLVDPLAADPRPLGDMLYHQQAFIGEDLRIFGVGFLGCPRAP